MLDRIVQRLAWETSSRVTIGDKQFAYADEFRTVRKDRRSRSAFGGLRAGATVRLAIDEKHPYRKDQPVGAITEKKSGALGTAEKLDSFFSTRISETTSPAGRRRSVGAASAVPESILASGLRSPASSTASRRSPTVGKSLYFESTGSGGGSAGGGATAMGLRPAVRSHNERRIGGF